MPSDARICCRVTFITRPKLIIFDRFVKINKDWHERVTRKNALFQLGISGKYAMVLWGDNKYHSATEHNRDTCHVYIGQYILYGVINVYKPKLSRLSLFLNT